MVNSRGYHGYWKIVENLIKMEVTMARNKKRRRQKEAAKKQPDAEKQEVKGNQGTRKKQKQGSIRAFFTQQALFAYAVWGIFLYIPHLSRLIYPFNELMIIGVGTALIGITFPYIAVIVPEVTGLIVFNEITGTMTSRGPGFNFLYPWETIREGNFFSLEILRKGFEETYASQDGPLMLVKPAYQYAPSVARLVKFRAVDDSVIEKGFTDVISSLLSSVISKKSAEESRTKIKETEQEVLKIFTEERTIRIGENTVSRREQLEDEYGIDFKLFTITDIDFSADYQQTRSSGARMKKISTMIREFATENRIENKDAANLVMVEQGKIKKTVFEIEGLGKSLDGLTGALGKIIEKFVKGGGD